MERPDVDPYEVLGLEPGATHAEIRAAYLRLAKKHHPDKNPGDKTSEWIFKAVGRAYERLRDGHGNHERDRQGGRARAQAERERQQRAEQARREKAEQEERRRRERDRRERGERARREQEQAERDERERREREQAAREQAESERRERAERARREHERRERERWEQEQAQAARDRWERGQQEQAERARRAGEEAERRERERGTSGWWPVLVRAYVVVAVVGVALAVDFIGRDVVRGPAVRWSGEEPASEATEPDRDRLQANASMYYEGGRLALEAEDFTTGADLFRRGLALHPGNPALRHALVDALNERRHRRQLQALGRQRPGSSLQPSARVRSEGRDVEVVGWRQNQRRGVPSRAAESATGAAVPEPARVGGNISPPTKTRDVSPVYPEVARAARVEGVVILEATIGPTGAVTDVNVLRSVPLLDEAAVAAVRQWQYTPTLLNGVPVPVIMTVTVNFSLR